MKKFYCVTSSFDDKGKVKAHIDEVTCNLKPKNTNEAKNKMDIYKDWFDTLKEAQEFKTECYKS